MARFGEEAANSRSSAEFLAALLEVRYDGASIVANATADTGVWLALDRLVCVRQVNREERGRSSGWNQGVAGKVLVPIVLMEGFII